MWKEGERKWGLPTKHVSMKWIAPDHVLWSMTILICCRSFQQVIWSLGSWCTGPRSMFSLQPIRTKGKPTWLSREPIPHRLGIMDGQHAAQRFLIGSAFVIKPRQEVHESPVYLELSTLLNILNLINSVLDFLNAYWAESQMTQA